MRCISLVIFLTFSSCFLALPALENVTQADEIELLERKLEYLRAKKELDLELEIVKAKIQKLDQDYSDVVDTKAAVSVSSTSEAPETSEPKEPAKVEEVEEVEKAPAKVASSTGADREWVAGPSYCEQHLQGFHDIEIDEDGAFSFVQYFNEVPQAWYAFVDGNLKLNEANARVTGDSKFGGIKAEQEGEAWNITLSWNWKGGSCDVNTVMTKGMKVEAAPTEVALESQSLNFEWIAEGGYCGKWAHSLGHIEINEDGAFSFVQSSGSDWYAPISGNLRRNEAKQDQDKSSTHGARLRKITAEQDGEAWNITLSWRYPGGSCLVKSVITRR